MKPVEIVAGPLVLRAWRPADADAVCRACQDPEIQRWTTVPVPYTEDHARGFVTGFSPAAWAAGTKAPLGVFDATTGELLGSCGLVALDLAAGTAEIGYWVAPWARGRGVAVEAARATARWAFDDLGVRVLLWRADLGNHASRRVAERLGFRFEGVRRAEVAARDGARTDCWAASLLPGELRDGDAPADPVAAARARVLAGPQPVLAAGPALTLRPLRPADADDVAATASDPESVRWTTVPSPYGRADAEAFIGEFGPGVWRRGDGAVWAIADAADRYCGAMELRLLADAGRGAEVGFVVAPWARGRGYATAALRAVSRWAFEALAVPRIEWYAHVGNDGSRRVAEKAGFHPEGVQRSRLRHRGDRVDAWVAALLPGDL